MTPAKQLFVKLYADFRRSGLSSDGTLAGSVPLGKDKYLPILEMDPDAMNKRLMELGRTGGILPLGTINPAYRMHYSAQRWDGQSALAQDAADGLKLIPEWTGPVDPEHLLDLREKKKVYKEFFLFGQRLKDRAMDMRLVNSAWMWFLADRTVSWVEERMNAPDITDAEMQELLDDFGPGLVVMADILGHSAEQKTAIAAARSNLEAQVKEKQAQAADAQTEAAVRHDLPVSRQALLEAARRHVAKTGGKGAPLGALPATPAQGPGKAPRIMD